MEKIYDWTTPLLTAAVAWGERFIDYLPKLTGAVVLLLLGWLIARIVKSITIRLAKGIDRVAGRIRFAGAQSDSNFGESYAQVIGNVLYWVALLFFITSAASLLGMNMFAGWLSKLVNHLPNILSGALIVCAGLIFSNLIYQAILTATPGMKDTQRTFIARSAQIFMLFMLILIGVDQIGIDITVIVIVMSVGLGALLGGLAIAFSLGARTLVGNLIGIRYLNPDYRIGERVRVGEYEGVVLEITSVAIVLDAEQGRVTIPARILSEQPSTLVRQESADE